MKYQSILAFLIASIASAAVSSNHCDSVDPSIKDLCKKVLEASTEIEKEVTTCESKCSDDNCKTKCVTDALPPALASEQTQGKIKCISDCKDDTACLSKCIDGKVSKEDLDKTVKCTKDCKDDVSCSLKCYQDVLKSVSTNTNSNTVKSTSQTSSAFFSSNSPLVAIAAASLLLV
ncbi:hypothetical protein K502DRAFT_325306 [Neoconidiobolus thromboides FSU 785]|nr:hypothetical protein K502DRAFT_325306 [Neoconidiobolus thromboides FSU 785]